MLKTIEIRNFKSIETVNLPLGRLNVLIGENGAGKSNILEAIALAGAASAGKLDNEFLASRGIRVTQPQFMRSAFTSQNANSPIEIMFSEGVSPPTLTYKLTNNNAPYSQWHCETEKRTIKFGFPDFLELLLKIKEEGSDINQDLIKKLNDSIKDLITGIVENNNTKIIADLPSIIIKNPETLDTLMANDTVGTKYWTDHLKHFIIYSPENTALRLFEREGQIEPLGINGEGLLKLLSVLSETTNDGTLDKIKTGLQMIGWFRDFNIVKDPSNSLGKMTISDKYLDHGTPFFDQKSANEGFLFLTFYFALFAGALTPKFFAVDNVDASLNPKLCTKLVQYLMQLATENDKQVILTTHNPAVLDGLNLDDDDQRLFVVSRGSKGQTRIKRIEKPRLAEGQAPIKLSEAFLRGSLGGLPKGF